MPNSSSRASEDVPENGLSLKLCLQEQLSWQMTLLHMNKRGLQATLHVSFLPAHSVRAVGEQGAKGLTCLYPDRPWRKWIQICPIHMKSASSFIIHILHGRRKNKKKPAVFSHMMGGWGECYERLHCKYINKYISPKAFHWRTLYFTISILLVGADSWWEARC